jgi:hypothetical protein
MPAQLRYKLGRERNCPATRLRLRSLGHEPAAVQFCRRLDNADNTRAEVEVLTPESDQLAPAETAEGREQNQQPVTAGTASAIANTTGSEIISRSTDSSLQAASIRQG